MSYSDFLSACDLIERNRESADFLGPRDPPLIAAAERALQLIFPRSYREFLLRYGCGDIAGAEFYGVLTDDFENSGVPDAVWLTVRERKDSQLRGSLVIVYALGEGSYSCIDCAQKNSEGESPVVVWPLGGPEPGTKLELEAEDFGAFLLSKLRLFIT
jgi:antitoxin YobK